MDSSSPAATGRERMAASGAPARAGFRLPRVLKALGIVGWAVLLLPYAIAPLYRIVDPPFSTLMLGQWLRGRAVEQRPVPLSAMSPFLIRSVVASEDSRFCSHHGVDWHEVQEVVEAAIEDGEAGRGGSSIPMQLAKNLFLWPQRSFVRKALEVPLALWLDLVLTKKRLLEIYLNVVEWGPGIFGIEAAARRHFGKGAARLDAGEAALLAAALPNPVIRDPARPKPGHRRVARIVQTRAAQADSYLGCLGATAAVRR